MDLANTDIIERLQYSDFGVLGISTTSVAFHRSLQLARAAKATTPETDYNHRGKDR